MVKSQQELLINKMSFSDVDITSLGEYNFEDMLMEKGIADNQVVSVRDISSPVDKLYAYVSIPLHGYRLSKSFCTGMLPT